jgi:CDP-diacylglycerol--glycerol-3-phosphate 3-phosphatidyltransferase
LVWNIPNILTLLRIVLIPVLTDWLDGYLARRLKQLSVFGAFLDPVADKLMVAVALVLLVQDNPTATFAIPAAIIIGREIAISALREWMSEIGERTKVKVSVIGKVKTTAQMVAILLLLFKLPIGPFPTHDVGMILMYVAATLTLWSMFVYMRAAWPVIVGNSS